MSGKILVDTNIIIALFAGEDSISERLAMAEEVFIASTVLGELYYGAYKSHKGKENLLRIDELAERTAILGCDRETARHYGFIKDNLRRQGRPIPENDLWIAACAQQHDLVLVTRDDHFKAITGLKLEMW